MPIYTYRCHECRHEFEQRQRMSDEPLTSCPVCNGGIRRVVNSVGVVFKGSGFYVTDNRGNNSANSKNKSADSEKSDSSKPKESESKSKTPTTESKSTTSASAAA